jgi:hypothetical protein
LRLSNNDGDDDLPLDTGLFLNIAACFRMFALLFTGVVGAGTGLVRTGFGVNFVFDLGGNALLPTNKDVGKEQ